LGYSGKGAEWGEGGFAKISPFREHGNVNKGEDMREKESTGFSLYGRKRI
jgi:hypothetical protein